ncbi:MAG TPA: NAD(P)/FAD-dependent oxidoreductase [Niabella sp.]
MYTDQVIIIGAGIAGLSLAIQLAENKKACIVLEERQFFDRATSGVRISAQGVRILEKMKIKNIGEHTERTIMYFGSIVTNFTLGNSAGNSPAIMVTRLAVHEQLMERAKLLGITVVTGFRVVAVNEYPGGVEATSEEGQCVTGRFLVGADGVGSTIRKILNPGQRSGKTYAGYLGVGLITSCDEKIEMSLYQNPGDRVGVASIGKINSNDANNNIFLWTHLYIPEGAAKAMTNEKVMEMLVTRSQYWTPALRKIFELFRASPDLIIAHGPVYNGKIPSSWVSKNMILIGDAAHPYGPGGQGISMALKDAEELCSLLCNNDPSEEKKTIFQKVRSAEAKKFGESAEIRNKPEKQITSRWGIFFRGVIMKLYHFFNRGGLKYF